jgi:hypothetical protein
MALFNIFYHPFLDIIANYVIDDNNDLIYVIASNDLKLMSWYYQIKKHEISNYPLYNMFIRAYNKIHSQIIIQLQSKYDKKQLEYNIHKQKQSQIKNGIHKSNSDNSPVCETKQLEDNAEVKMSDILNQSLLNIVAEYTVNSSFEYVVENYDLELIEWYYQIKKPKRDIRQICRIFYYLCEEGLLQIAMWLHKTVKITKKEYMKSFDRALNMTCSNGYSEFAEWLIDTFSLTREYCTSNNNNTFRLTCSNGHLEVAKMLHKRFVFTKEDCLTVCSIDYSKYNNYSIYGYEYMFKNVCKNGYVYIIIWFILEFKMTRNDNIMRHIKFIQLDDLNIICILKWLIDNLQITKQECEAIIAINYNEYKTISNESGSYVMKWLYDKFK